MAQQPAFTDPEKLAADIEKYFALCESSRSERELKSGAVQVRYANPPTFAGLAVFLNVSKRTLARYVAAADSDTELATVDNELYKTMCHLVSRARDRIDALTAGAALSGDIDSKTAAMILGGFGYSAKTDDSPTVTVRIVGADTAAVDDWSK